MLQAWELFNKLVGVMAVRTEEDYAPARAVVEVLLDAIGADENRPLAEGRNYLGNHVPAYEDEHVISPEGKPKEVMRFLMDPHELNQDGLADCAPQGRMSDILDGRRAISKDIAQKLARRFRVSPAVLL